MISKRDVLRGVVTDLQKMTGVKAFKIRDLNSQDDCYKAVYEVVKADVSKTKDKKIQSLEKTLQAVHKVNCDIVKEREDLRKKILIMSSENTLLKKDNETLRKLSLENENSKKMEKFYQDENKILWERNDNLKKFNKILFIIDVLAGACLVCNLFF